MDERWYNKHGDNDDVVLVSRIRLLRNFASYKFTERMTPEEQQKLIETVDEKLKMLSKTVNQNVQKIPVEALRQEEKFAFNERLLINKSALASKNAMTVYASEDESFSLTIGGDDHVRLLLSAHGQNLSGLWEKLDKIDNCIDSKMPYAYSEKLGFKTADIANVGTGMRAYYVMHLPLLSEEKNFAELVREIGRYGVVIKDAWNIGKRRPGGLYVLYNQRTLGLQETDIIDILTSVANRLMEQERDLRRSVSSLALKDRVMRSYGIMKYAMRMDLYEACNHLSNILLGISMGYLTVLSDLSVYELMLGVLPGNLQVYYKDNFDENEIKIKRSEYLKTFLQDIQPTI